MNERPLVLFDMDGVLLDSANAIVQSLSFALKEVGHEELLKTDLRRFVGPPLHAMIEDLIPRETEAVKKQFESHYRSHNNEFGPDLTPVFPHIEELLSELSTSHELVIATSKLQSAAELVLARKEISKHFSAIFGTAPNSGESKADVIGRAISDRRKSLVKAMVGDRVHDVDGAKAHGLCCIGVTWGYALPNELELAKPEFITDSPKGLLTILQAMN